MKTNNFIRYFARINPFAILVLACGMLLLSACGGSSNVGTVEEGDNIDRAPYFSVNEGSVMAGETIIVAMDTGVTVKFYDETGLNNYSIAVGDGINLSGSISGNSSPLTIDISTLTIDETYDASISVTDTNSQTTQIDFKMTVVETLTPPVFAVGSATPGGWSLAQKTALTVDNDDKSVYTWQGNLLGGEIKFANYNANDFCGGPWILAATVNEAPNLDGSGNTYNRTEDCPSGEDDKKWVISQPGTYQITIDTEEGKVYFDLLGESNYYQNLYLVGSATPGDWNISEATALIRNENNPALFTWTGTLIAGSFKISTQNTGYDAGRDWIHPAVENQALTSNEYAVVVSGGGATDYQWTITEAGTYTISIDLENETIDIGAPYANLYLVGSATPGDWSLSAATEMQRTSLKEFTTTVQLIAGEFKIATVLSFDPGYDWIHPLIEGQSLMESAYMIQASGTGSDLKWVVGAEDVGTYDITINVQDETILIEKQ